METITTAITTAVTSLSTQIQSAVGANLPALLGIAAIFIVINVSWKLVKKFSKG